MKPSVVIVEYNSQWPEFYEREKKMTQACIALLPREVLQMWKEGGLLS
jgi:hypothetical protein